MQQYYYSQIGLCCQVKGILVYFYVHQHQFLKFLTISQEEGTCIVSCVQQHWFLKKMTFFSGERDSSCFLSASVLLTKTCAFLLGERDSQYPFTAAEFVFKFCLKIFWLWLEIVLGVTYLPCQLCRYVFFLVAAGYSFGLQRSVVLLWRENGFRCYLLTYHTSCAVVSVFGCGRK
jgi:hypothetical protein